MCSPPAINGHAGAPARRRGAAVGARWVAEAVRRCQASASASVSGGGGSELGVAGLQGLHTLGLLLHAYVCVSATVR